jgi:carboxyl-terminal processing protease
MGVSLKQMKSVSQAGDKMRGARLWIAGGVLIAAASLGAFYGASSVPEQIGNELAEQPIRREFVKVLELIDEHYVVTPDRARLTRGAVTGMLHSLDPHSNFYDRREFSEMQDEQSSHFYGIGVTINQRNGRIYVLGVSQGTPAERAGLRYGDALIAVDGHSAKDWTQSDALNYVRGERGTDVEITVERAGEPEPVTVRITRDEVPFPSVRTSFMLRPEVGYIGLTGGFNQETSEELRQAIAQLKAQGMTALILDLRRNPGGLLKQAIQVSETFLPRDVEIVAVRGREGRYPNQVYRSDNDAPELMPLLVLINESTASASEIVAGAMQDHGRAWLVGEESFGKGLVQMVYRLPGNTGLTLTTAKYYTPSGRSIQRPYNNRSLYDYFFARRAAEAKNAALMKNKKNSAHKSMRTGDKLANADAHDDGGVRPDTVIKIPEEDIRLRDASFEFARLLVAGLVPNLAEYKINHAAASPHLRSYELQLTEAVIIAFRDFVRAHPELQVSEADVSRQLDYVRRRLRAEIVTATYGLEVADQFLIESDAQALRALEDLPKARRLSAQARLLPVQ